MGSFPILVTLSVCHLLNDLLQALLLFEVRIERLKALQAAPGHRHEKSERNEQCQPTHDRKKLNRPRDHIVKD